MRTLLPQLCSRTYIAARVRCTAGCSRTRTLHSCKRTLHSCTRTLHSWMFPHTYAAQLQTYAAQLHAYAAQLGAPCSPLAKCALLVLSDLFQTVASELKRAFRLPDVTIISLTNALSKQIEAVEAAHRSELEEHVQLGQTVGVCLRPNAVKPHLHLDGASPSHDCCPSLSLSPSLVAVLVASPNPGTHPSPNPRQTRSQTAPDPDQIQSTSDTAFPLIHQPEDYAYCI